jgi:hypothetical protein
MHMAKAVEGSSDSLFWSCSLLEPFPENVEFKVGGAWVQIVSGEVKP